MVKEDELLKACEVLFGEGLFVSRQCLKDLRVSGVKTAYRKRARETHPDVNLPEAGIRGSAGAFVRVREAYERLVAYVAEHADVPEPRTLRDRPPRGPRSQATDYGESLLRPRRAHHSPVGTETFRGPIPRRRLPLGHYLYFSGRVDWATVVQAVGWQMIQRPRVGELASRVGWLTNRDVQRIIRKGRVVERFGEGAVRLGLLSENQVKALLIMQEDRQRRLGEYFVELGLFTSGEMEWFVRECSAHNESLGRPSAPTS